MRQGLLFSIIVTIVFCAPALAYDWSTNPGDGSEANPYQISTPEQMNAIGADTGYMYLDPEFWGKHFRLMNDIDMSALESQGIFYNVIGNRYNPFTGVFDGDGYTISNLTIHMPNSRDVGLFGYLNGAEITHVRLINVHVSGENYVGGLAGSNHRGTITDCSVEGTISGNQSVGGLLGLDSAGIISDCSTAGHVVGDDNTGGLIGSSQEYGTVTDCYSRCDITGGTDAGGLIGLTLGVRITNCYTTGSVVAESHLGGLVGDTASYSSAGKNTIENCYATGDVTGHDRVGGLVGDNGSTLVRNCYATGSVAGVNQGVGGLIGTNYKWPSNNPHGSGVIENCYSTGKVTGQKATGGLVGRHWNQSIRVYDSFWDRQTSGWTYSSGGTGKTTAQMQTQSTFTSAGWNFGNTWYMSGYPVLQWEISPLQPLIDAAQDGDVIVVEPGVYEGRLYFKGKNITLTSTDPTKPDIVASTVLKGKGTGSVVTFAGTENQTCILTGFTITGGVTDARGGGIAGNGTQAGIDHCTIENNSAAYGAGIDQCHGRIENCIIRNNSASVNGAGLAVCGGDITNCLVYENTAGNYGGGFHYCNGAITNCTVSENTAATNGRGLNNCNGVIANSIIWGKSIQEVFNCPGTTYCCYPGASGIGNIDTDPLFVDVAGDDYHLLPSSTCINAGDPSYVPEPDETDLAGISRRIGSAVDMGCYEFPNAAPVADAGEDQVFYASLDGTALVQLDGTGSTDADGDALEYFWYNDANELIATGAEPNVLFGVGQYEITLIVNDGTEDSLPNSCVVTVVDPFEALEAAVTEWVQDAGIANSLLAKVDAAQKILEDGNANNDSAAAGSLWAFINAVNAQRGKKISEEVADSLITAAEHIIDML